VRFGSVITSAELPGDPVMDEQLCTRCLRCVDICPVKAIGEEDYPRSLTDKTACASRALELAGKFASPCGFCIKVCPIGEDRKLYGREELDIYNEEDVRFDRYHKAWKHTRSYGSRK